MNLKPYKKKLHRDTVSGLADAITHLLTLDNIMDHEDRLHLAILAEVKCLAEKRLLSIKPEYTISFTPAQAFALSILSNDYFADKRTYLGNKLHQINLRCYLHHKFKNTQCTH